MSRPYHDEHPPTAAPVPSIPKQRDEQSRQLKPLRQDAQDAALEARLAQNEGHPR